MLASSFEHSKSFWTPGKSIKGLKNECTTRGRGKKGHIMEGKRCRCDLGEKRLASATEGREPWPGGEERERKREIERVQGRSQEKHFPKTNDGENEKG